MDIMKHGKLYYVCVAIARLAMTFFGGMMIWAALGDNPPKDYDPAAMIFGIVVLLVGLFGGTEDW